MINIKDLTGRYLKKTLGAKSASFRYHNRNKSGGNFGIDVRGVNGLDYELNGDYNVEGNVKWVGFGKIYWTRGNHQPQTLEELEALMWCKIEQIEDQESKTIKKIA